MGQSQVKSAGWLANVALEINRLIYDTQTPARWG